LTGSCGGTLHRSHSISTNARGEVSGSPSRTSSAAVIAFSGSRRVETIRIMPSRTTLPEGLRPPQKICVPRTP
jgi:hypothetical protein